VALPSFDGMRWSSIVGGVIPFIIKAALMFKARTPMGVVG